MMTRQEIEDERKRSEGDPAIKMRQRGARNELLKHRMMAEVREGRRHRRQPDSPASTVALPLRPGRRASVAPTVSGQGRRARRRR
jgi:flagellar biosynthetic protein FlhB